MTQTEREQIDTAVTVLRLLRHGLHPETREPLADDHLMHRPTVIRAIALALDALLAAVPDLPAEESTKIFRTMPARAGKAWGVEEDAELRTLFAERRPLKEMMSELERTCGSVTARLVRLGLVSDPDEARRILSTPPS